MIVLQHDDFLCRDHVLEVGLDCSSGDDTPYFEVATW